MSTKQWDIHNSFRLYGINLSKFRCRIVTAAHRTSFWLNEIDFDVQVIFNLQWSADGDPFLTVLDLDLHYDVIESAVLFKNIQNIERYTTCTFAGY